MYGSTILITQKNNASFKAKMTQERNPYRLCLSQPSRNLGPTNTNQSTGNTKNIEVSQFSTVFGLTVIMASGMHASICHKLVWRFLYSGIFNGFDGIR